MKKICLQKQCHLLLQLCSDLPRIVGACSFIINPSLQVKLSDSESSKMNKVARGMTDYVIRKGVVKETDRGVYEYGFTIAMETGLCILACLSISMALHSFFEGIVFFLTFIPLRSYAGGLHLNSYRSCFSLSCISFLTILILGKYGKISTCIALICLFISEVLIYCLYPVENVNREVDAEENNFFKKRLCLFLIIDGFAAVIMILLGWKKYLQVMTITFVMIVITMVIGKLGNKKSLKTNDLLRR